MKTTKFVILAMAALVAMPQMVDAKKPKNLKNEAAKEIVAEKAAEIPAVKEEVAPVITEECIINVSLFNESVKNKQFADALGPWQEVYNNCPNANKAIYTAGAKIVAWQFENAQTEEEKTALKQLVMEMYDKRAKYFGDDPKYPTAYILGEKAMDYCEYFPEDELKLSAYGWLKESVKGMGAQSKITVLSKFAELSNKLYKSDSEKYAEQYIADYQQVTELLSAIAANKANKNADAAQQQKDYIDNIFALSGAADCNKLDELYAGTVQANLDNLDLLGKIIYMYRRVRCTESDVYFAAAEASHKLQPTAESAAGCAAMSAKKGNHKDAIAYYEQAVSLSDNDEDKANYLYNCAVYAKENLKQFSTAREYCRKSLEINPNQGRCYILIGVMYAESKPYDDPTLNKTVFWAACDKFVKAKQVDPSCAEIANKMISTYSQYYPSKEEMFFNAAKGLAEGQRFTVGGWIGETTTCR